MDDWRQGKHKYKFREPQPGTITGTSFFSKFSVVSAKFEENLYVM